VIGRARIPVLLAALGMLLAAPTVARADFGIVPGSVSAVAENENGSLDFQAGSHPYSFTVGFNLKTEAGGKVEGGAPREVVVDLPPGLVGNPEAVPKCTRQAFEGFLPSCPVESQIGVLRVSVESAGLVAGPIYNMVAPPGQAAQIGFDAATRNALQGALVKTEAGYAVEVSALFPLETSEVAETIWGVPADPGHTPERGHEAGASQENEPSSAPLLPYLTLPASCESAPEITVRVDSVLAPGVYSQQSAPFRDTGGNPSPFSGCDSVPFDPAIAAQPTTKLASNPSGLDFELKLPNKGLLSPGGIAETQPRKTVVTLPEGVTVNPSFAEGVAVCTEAQYKAEQVESSPGEGCPEASKLGSVVARSPLIEEAIEGSLYLAAPYENPFGTLTALYLVARAPERGVLVKQAGKVELNSGTGQITSTFDALPPLPYGDFKLHFREGARAPLSTPQACGDYQTVSELTPFSSSVPKPVLSSMTIERGADGGTCPAGGVPPLKPGLLAGSINNAAGRYSPFYARIFRSDAEQEITHFSIKLPLGVTGRLAGIPFCSDAAIAAAKSRERQPHGGQEEIDHPSCPQTSEVGHTLVGAGVGSSLTYVPGKVYLAGPYRGDSLSIVAITAAKAGPFDLGTVVVREGLEINPETAEVFVDSTGSDPIPHIIAGVPVRLRDIRIYVDKPHFMLNPTSCKPTGTASTVLGAGTDFSSEADDRPVTITTRYQAADCGSLGYKPRLELKLKGATKRSGNPALTAILRPRPGDANSQRVSVALPHSEFLDQGHIKTICTRVQFKAGPGNGAQCPAGSIYGKAKVWTPLLADPLEGPVFLRSSEHPLPDLVLALHGLIDFDAVGRIDSVNGGIRNTFETVPDAPIEKVELSFGGGKKSLLENSTDLCVGSHKATAEFAGQNGKELQRKVPLGVRCPKQAKRARDKRGQARLGRRLLLDWHPAW
jgi:hypothetical protein